MHQRISPSTRPCEILRNIISSYDEELLTPRPTPKLQGQPLVGSPRLLIRYIRKCPLQLEAVPSSTTWERAFLWWMEPSYHNEEILDCYYEAGIA